MLRKSKLKLKMASNSISRIAWAKINLDLLITGRRDDGYHLLDSLVVFADYGDEISVRPSRKLNLSITGPFADMLVREGDNIVLRAARLLQDKFDIKQGANIELVKNLPVSSGIGGGSADAAAAIHALMELWNLTDKEAELGELPLSLGADVPVCMASETMHMSGVGERLRPVSLKFPLYLLLVNPGVSLSTAEIFRSRAARKAEYSCSRNLPDEIVTIDQLLDILGRGGNDLEYDACAAAPKIKKALALIRSGKSCIYAGMSGSGATGYGIFSSLEAAQAQATTITHDFPDWWVRSVRAR